MKKPPGSFSEPVLPRREFLKYSTAALGLASPALKLPLASANERKTPETLVKVLYDSMNEKQKKAVPVDPKSLRELHTFNWLLTQSQKDEHTKMVQGSYDILHKQDLREPKKARVSAASSSDAASAASASDTTAYLFK